MNTILAHSGRMIYFRENSSMCHGLSMGRMVSTTVDSFTNGVSLIQGQLLMTTNGQALTLVLHTVVLVPFNHMLLMALMQLGIWHKTQTTFPLKTIIKGALMSLRQDDPVKQIQGYWVKGGSQSGGTPDRKNPMLESSGLWYL